MTWGVTSFISSYTTLVSFITSWLARAPAFAGGFATTWPDPVFVFTGDFGVVLWDVLSWFYFWWYHKQLFCTINCQKFKTLTVMGLSLFSLAWWLFLCHGLHSNFRKYDSKELKIWLENEKKIIRNKLNVPI